jgi:hypothetical protein
VSLDCVKLTVNGGVVFAGAWISGGGDAITRTGGLGLLASGWGSRVVSGRAAHCRSGSISLWGSLLSMATGLLSSAVFCSFLSKTTG